MASDIEEEEAVLTIPAGSCLPNLCYCCGNYRGPDVGVCDRCGDTRGYRWYCSRCGESHQVLPQGMQLALRHAGIAEPVAPGMVIVAGACPNCGETATTFDYTVVRLVEATIN